MPARRSRSFVTIRGKLVSVSHRMRVPLSEASQIHTLLGWLRELKAKSIDGVIAPLCMVCDEIRLETTNTSWLKVFLDKAGLIPRSVLVYGWNDRFNRGHYRMALGFGNNKLSGMVVAMRTEEARTGQTVWLIYPRNIKKLNEIFSQLEVPSEHHCQTTSD
jgi:hypothetical protein